MTRPQAFASCADTRRPVHIMSSARACPISRGSSHVVACSPLSPRCAKELTKNAFSAAKRTSHAAANERPMPAAGPLIAPTTGLRTAITNVTDFS